MKLPPVPKWNPVTDDFNAADFVLLAQAYDRSLLPAGIVFPRAGQVWEAVRDCEVSVWTRRTNPGPALSKVELPNGVTVTMSGPAKPELCIPWCNGWLRKGERVRVLELNDPKPLTVNLRPLRYDALHGSLIPLELRTAAGYVGYWLSVSTARPKYTVHKSGVYLNEDFTLVEDVIS
jgi:hypothetical protein